MIGRPTIVRYLRRNELLPSEKSSDFLSSDPLMTDPLQYKKPRIVIINASPQPDPPPRLTPTDRLLYRDKLRNDPTLLRRPARKLLFSTTHEAIIPLSVQT